MTIKDWLAENVTTDKRALDWFASDECEDRIVRAYREMLSGYELDPSRILKTTVTLDAPHDGIVNVHGINFYSICAHHFLPFFGTIDVAYVPGDRILGLGKFPRLVQAYSRRFQIQEFLVRDIANEVLTSGGARAVWVKSSGRHMCMCSRGPSDPSAITDTTYWVGDAAVLRQHGLLP